VIVRFLTLNAEAEQIVFAVMELQDKKLIISKEDKQAMEERGLLVDYVLPNLKEYSREKNLREWMKNLPLFYTGTYMRAEVTFVEDQK